MSNEPTQGNNRAKLEPTTQRPTGKTEAPSTQTSNRPITKLEPSQGINRPVTKLEPPQSTQGANRPFGKVETTSTQSTYRSVGKLEPPSTQNRSVDKGKSHLFQSHHSTSQSSSSKMSASNEPLEPGEIPSTDSKPETGQVRSTIYLPVNYYILVLTACHLIPSL